MRSKRNYLANLVHFACVDREMNASEREYIKKVGNRIGLPEGEVEAVLMSTADAKPDLPGEEVLRFILLVDLFRLMAIDGHVHEKEVEHLAIHAEAFGFDREVLDGLTSKLKRHMQMGYQSNDFSRIILDAVFEKSSKNKVNEKYDQRGA